MDEEVNVNANVRCAMKPLDGSVVHKICSGQIITTLAVAVKELIENSLDAGAKTVEIRLHDYGTSVIEVRDDGCGVERENRPVFALKNYTSKITEFSDIYNLDTYGFRGEAINSLCTIGDVSVITRHEEDNYGTLLVFDRSGNIIEEKPHARMVGTTVFVKNIFVSFPVRRKLLLTNIKREFAKAVDMIKAYCLVSTGARIICTNQIANKSPMTVVVTDGTNVLNNISSAFGVDQVKNLLAIPRQLPDTQLLEDFRIIKENEENDVNFDGYISSCVRGEGRNTKDRQFVYVNSRPCDYEKVTRLINYMYRQYQKHKYPFLFMNLILPPDTVDVNCSPDKREVILKNEKLVLATIKASLLSLYRSVQSVSTIENNKLPSVQFKLDDCFLKTEANSSCNNSFVSDENSVIYASSGDTLYTSENSVVFESSVTENDDSHCIKSTEVIEISSTFNVQSMNGGPCMSTDNYDDDSAISNSGIEKKKKIVYDSNKRCYNLNRIYATFDVARLIDHEDGNEEAGCVLKEEKSDILKFRAALDPAQNEHAEKELRQQITKEMFSKMKIVGQLNKSFIVVHLESDLFVIDQHAADEIYNFENLMKTSTLQNQRLVVPTL